MKSLKVHSIQLSKQICRLGSSNTQEGFVAGMLAILLGLYAAATLFQGLFGAVPVSKILGFFIASLLLLWWLLSPQPKIQYLTGSILCASIVVALSKTVDIGQDITDITYFVTTLLFLCYISEGRNAVLFYDAMNRMYMLFSIVLIVSALVIASLLITHTGYSVAWGGDRYFRGYCNSEHTLASVCCMLLGFLLVMGRQRGHMGWNGAISLILVYAILETGARTYLIPAGIILILMISELTARRWVRVLLVGGVAFGITVLFSRSGMGNKFDFVYSNTLANSFLSAISNGRNDIWWNDFLFWISSGVDGFAVGNSFSSVYAFNSSSLGSGIWSHNDFIMIACSLGIVGLVVYVLTITRSFTRLSCSMSKAFLLLMIAYLVFPAILNGFYPYQHLVYSFVLLATYCVAKSQNERKKMQLETTDNSFN